MQIRISIPDETAAQITKITKDTGLSVPQVFTLMWVIYGNDLAARLSPVSEGTKPVTSTPKAAKPSSALDMLESLI